MLPEHPDVAEEAVRDPVAIQVPKAFVTLSSDRAPSAETARSILGHARERLAPHQWIHRLEFRALPKTTSGKIRRAVLRVPDEVGTEFLAG